jgi:hypothetical protein
MEGRIFERRKRDGRKTVSTTTFERTARRVERTFTGVGWRVEVVKGNGRDEMR